MTPETHAEGVGSRLWRRALSVEVGLSGRRHSKVLSAARPKGRPTVAPFIVPESAILMLTAGRCHATMGREARASDRGDGTPRPCARPVPARHRPPATGLGPSAARCQETISKPSWGSPEGGPLAAGSLGPGRLSKGFFSILLEGPGDAHAGAETPHVGWVGTRRPPC